jgi:hypothetical protein
MPEELKRIFADIQFNDVIQANAESARRRHSITRDLLLTVSNLFPSVTENPEKTSNVFTNVSFESEYGPQQTLLSDYFWSSHLVPSTIQEANVQASLHTEKNTFSE